MQGNAVKSVPLRRRLLLLAVAGMLPIALMSGIALVALFEQQRAQATRAGLEIARALSIAVDAELKRSMSALEVLANSTRLDANDEEGFRRAIARTLPQQPDWRAVILADPSGAPLVHSGVPHGSAMPPLAE
ncbi:MAG TPA: hypothetical protein VI300_26555, partial [Solirubrobacter sp.]